MSPFPRPVYGPLEPYAPDRRPAEVDLSDNTNRWGAHPAALEVVRGADAEALLRYPPVYADALRDAVSRRFGVPPEAVATGCGSDDLLDSTFRAACEAGDGVAFLPPTFSMVEIFARMNALEARPVGAAPDDDPLQLPDPEQLVDAAAQGNPSGGGGLVYLCRPNNPTGELQPRSWVEALLDAAEARGERGPVVLIDEAYADYAPDNFLARALESPRAVVVRTLSKLYGLAGLRVGFAVGAPTVIREIEKSRGPYKVNRLAEAAAVAALDDAAGWLPEIRAATLEGRARLAFELAARGYEPVPSAANFVLVPVDDAVWVTASLRLAGVAVRPFPGLPGIGDAIRVSVGPPHELDRLLSALDGLYA
jgi:histidinol-phosphate aminotransferase